MAPNKKYLSLEEAAAQLGMKTEELIRLREKGDVRGFADRGTWKFKAEDVAEFRRRRQPDSDPDLPIMDDFDDDDLGRQATVIRKGGETKSDSDVRLSSDDKKKSRLTGSSAEVLAIGMQNSDSDVRLVEPTKSSKKGSDSDVTLVKPKLASKSDSDSDVKMIDLPNSAPDSDSDVKLLEPHRSSLDSDSDVRLSPLSSSDSDVKLIGPKSKGSKRGSDSDVTLLSKGPKGSAPADRGAKTHEMGPLDSGIGGIDFDLSEDRNSDSVLLDGDDSSITLAGDSGIQLAGDSGIRLADGSAIRLGATSGIRLGGDSGIRLADDSGVQLKNPADSGISLEGPDSSVRLADSGINLGDESGTNRSHGSSKTFDLTSGSSKTKRAGSSPKLKRSPADDLDSTSPILLSGLDDDDDLARTSPLLMSSDIDDASAHDLDMFDGSDTSELQSMGDSGQNVVIFEDDDEDAPPVSKKKRQKTVEESIFEIDEVGDEPLEELEVSDEDLSGENEIDNLAFDDGDEDLDESFTAGTSQLGFGAPQKFAVAQEVEWSAGVCTLLMASLCVLIAGSWVSADLLRTVWAQGEGSAIYPGVAGLLAGFWK